MCLRLAVILCHARRDPDTTNMQLSMDAKNSHFVLKVTNSWAERYPQSAHLLREEVVAWQKTGCQLEFIEQLSLN